MCRISEEIYNEGLEQGVQQGARDSLLQSVRNLVDTLGLGPSQALDALKVPKSQWDEYLALL